MAVALFAVAGAVVIAAAMIGVSVGKRLHRSSHRSALEESEYRFRFALLPEADHSFSEHRFDLHPPDHRLRLKGISGSRDSIEAINLVNKYVTMARGRAVRVVDDSITIVYSRQNRTKGRVTFTMDTAFDDVSEGDVGVLVIVELEEFGQSPFYKFIRDAGIPSIDDVLQVGTGDDLTDEIYAAVRRSKAN